MYRTNNNINNKINSKTNNIITIVNVILQNLIVIILLNLTPINKLIVIVAGNNQPI